MVVFDIDDTLYKEADFVKSGHNAVASYVNNHGLDLDINCVWPDEIRDVYHNHFPDISITDEASKSLVALKDSGIMIGIISDGRSVTQRNKIKALGLDRYVEPSNIIVSSEIGTDKYQSKPFEMLMDRNKSEIHWVYIADNPVKDFYWPRRLGWHTVMLRDIDGTNIHPQLIDEVDNLHQPDIVVDNIYNYIIHLIKNNKC